jgi:hypothetical protein
VDDASESDGHRHVLRPTPSIKHARPSFQRLLLSGKYLSDIRDEQFHACVCSTRSSNSNRSNDSNDNSNDNKWLRRSRSFATPLLISRKRRSLKQLRKDWPSAHQCVSHISTPDRPATTVRGCSGGSKCSTQRVSWKIAQRSARCHVLECCPKDEHNGTPSWPLEAPAMERI